jgi:hypothetical protein
LSMPAKPAAENNLFLRRSGRLKERAVFKRP